MVLQGCDNARICIHGESICVGETHDYIGRFKFADEFSPLLFCSACAMKMCGLDVTPHDFWRVTWTGEAASNETPTEQHVMQDAQVGSDGAISRHPCTTELEIPRSSHGTPRLRIGGDGGSAGHAMACRREVRSFLHRGAKGSVLVEISDRASMRGSGPYTAFVNVEACVSSHALEEDRAHCVRFDAVGSDGAISRLDGTPLLDVEQIVHGTPRVPHCGEKGKTRQATTRVSSGSVGLRRRPPCTTYTTVQQGALDPAGVPVDDAYLEALGGGSAGLLQDSGTKRKCASGREAGRTPRGSVCFDADGRFQPLSGMPGNQPRGSKGSVAVEISDSVHIEGPSPVIASVNLDAGFARHAVEDDRYHCMHSDGVGCDGPISRRCGTNSLDLERGAYGTRHVPISCDRAHAGYATRRVSSGSVGLPRQPLDTVHTMVQRGAFGSAGIHVHDAYLAAPGGYSADLLLKVGTKRKFASGEGPGKRPRGSVSAQETRRAYGNEAYLAIREACRMRTLQPNSAHYTCGSHVHSEQPFKERKPACRMRALQPKSAHYTLGSPVHPERPCKERKPALWDAVERGDVDTVIRLLLDGHDPRLKFQGWTPLMKAAEENYFEIAGILIDSKSSDINATNRNGRTALSFAAAPSNRGCERRATACQVLCLLLAHGASLNLRDATDRTAKQRAFAEGRQDAVDIFDSFERWRASALAAVAS